MIVVHPADNGGCGFYRLHLPATAVNRYLGIPVEVYTLINFDAFKLRSKNVTHVIMQRQTEPIQAEVVKAYKNIDIQVVHDLDDMLWNAPVYNAYRKIYNKSRNDTLTWIMKNANHITVSTEPLAEECKQRFGRLPTVVPNLLPIYKTVRVQERTNKKLRVGWAGSTTHSHDLLSLEYAIKSTQDKYQWVFMGYCPPELMPFVEFHPGVAVQHYLDSLAHLNIDVALAPLEVNRFNECKSNLKLLEFGLIGKPVVTTDIYPYRDNPGIKIKNRKGEWRDWLSAIDLYDRDESRRVHDAKLIQDYATQHVIDTSVNLGKVIKGWHLA